MDQWLLVIILAACGAGFLVIPLLRQGGSDPQPQFPKGADEAAGAVPSPASKPATVKLSSPSRRSNRLTAAAIGALVLGGAAALYYAAGTPATMTMQPPVLASASDAAAATSEQKLPDVDTMITRIVDRLKAKPDNAEDWRMLGWSYFETQHYAEAVDAYSHAVALDPKSAGYQSAYGEALVLAAEGKVTPEALKAFAVSLKADPKDERTIYFTGMAKRQKGDAKGAIEIAETAKAASIDVSKDLPPAPAMSEDKFASPPSQAVQQAQTMTAEEQQTMIRNMVSGLDQRLAKNPRDREGWIRLIRSRKVLGQPDEARTALNKALIAFNDDPTTQVELKAAALELGVPAVR